MILLAYIFPKLQTAKHAVRCLKSPVSGRLSTVNMLKGPKRLLNLHDSPFSMFFSTLREDDLGNVSVSDM